MGQKLETRTVPNLFYDKLEQMFFHWHEEVQDIRTWQHVSKKFSIPFGYGAAEMSALLPKELYRIF